MTRGTPPVFQQILKSTEIFGAFIAPNSTLPMLNRADTPEIGNQLSLEKHG